MRYRILTSLLIIALCAGFLPNMESEGIYAEAPKEEVTASSAVIGASVKTAPAADRAKLLRISPQANPDWYYGHEGDPTYTLSTINDLQGLAAIVNSGIFNFQGRTIVLGANIMGLSTDPIGTKTSPFAGTFDGNGKTISNLTINVPADKQYIGLFGSCAASSVLKNTNLSMTLNVNATTQIRYVGGMVGFTKGKIENCDVTATIMLASTMAANKNRPGMLRTIGGVAGQAFGEITGCTFDGEIRLSCPSNVNDEMVNVCGEVGGIVGIFGDQSDLSSAPPTLSSCTNKGTLNFNISGAGGKDRFGADLYARSQDVGGVAGYSMGNVVGCVNEGTIYTGIKSGSNLDTTTTTIKKPIAGFGASHTGGIVGSLRDGLFDSLSNIDLIPLSKIDNPPYNYYTKRGGKSGGAAALPKTVKIADCTNRGIVIGLTAVGGIVGSSTGWSLIEGCSNRADVMGTRWNKPFAAGIAGTSRSDILYCYNRGEMYSTAGAGYYCAGIAGQFQSDNTTATPDNDRVGEPTLTGCYTTGRVYLDSEGYRSGILVGENQGLIQNNAFIANLTPDGKIVDTNSGTVKDTIATSQLSVADLKGSKGVARLNTYAAGKGRWEMLYVRDLANANDGYPVLVRAHGDAAKMSLSSATPLAGAPSLAAGGDAKYSAALDPSPKVAMAGLYQNADFYVVPQSGTAGTNVSSTITYMATIQGMGIYKGSAGTISYRILPAPIADCTIQADPQVYNWKLQRPTAGKVNLYDEAGSLVSKSQYSVSDEYDPGKGTKAYNGTYYDYTHAHGRYYFYNIIVTAAGGANYEGTSKQAAWRIKSASLVAQRPASDPKYSPLDPESVTYGKTYFDINQNGKIEENEKFSTLKGTDDKTGASIKIPYTGSPIYPRVDRVAYKGVKLREATNYDYFERPLDFDFKYIYGNPNPEVDDGKNATPIHVSKSGAPETMTTRFTSGADFENYNNVFYQIVPRNVSYLKVEASSCGYTGKNVVPTFTLFGKAISKDNYTVTGVKANKDIGIATITIKGKKNLTGTTTFKFKIVPSKVKLGSLKAGKGSLTVKWTKVSSVQKIKNYQIRYRVKGASAWKVKTVPAKLTKQTLTSLKKGKQYYVSIRAKKGGYSGGWSSPKLSSKIK